MDVGVDQSRGLGNAAQRSATQRNADRVNVQAEREELRDAAEDHDDGNHQVDDATEIRGDTLAWGHLQCRGEGQAGGFSWGALGRAESSRPESSELFFCLLSRARIRIVSNSQAV